MRRLFSIAFVCVAATMTVVAAQPKAPAKDPAPPAGSGSATGSGVTTLPEDEPPKDMEGRDENPGQPGGATITTTTTVVAKPKRERPPGPYPIEEMWRPINLAANMSEVALGPHAQVKPYMGTDALRARYGITNKVQIGLTYVLGSIYNDNFADPMLPSKQKFHTGKAIGLDVTVLLKEWVGLRLGVPVYIKPVAVSLALGAPMKFQLGEKFAVGGLDDLLNITLHRFPPSFYQEAFNAVGEFRDRTNSGQSAGQLRISLFGVYQHKPKLAFIGRTGFMLENFSSNKADAGGLFYFIRAGFQFSPRKDLDLGLNIGFDDLAETGSFGPAGFAAFRI
jgi:hypothetical protein